MKIECTPAELRELLLGNVPELDVEVSDSMDVRPEERPGAIRERLRDHATKRGGKPNAD